MPTARIVASTYYLSNTSYLSVSNASNMYTNVDSTTYATVTHSRNSTTAYYFYLRGFDFSQIPSNATITSAIVKIKLYGNNRLTATTPALYNGTTSLNKNFSGSTSTSTKTVTCDITSDWNTYKGYGDNFGIRVQMKRTSTYYTAYLYVQGAEITVEYTLPPTEQMYIKDNGSWKEVSAVYRKINGAWVQQDDLESLFDTQTKYLKGN